MKSKKLYTRPTQDSIETLTLTISDGLIELYSNDDGTDIVTLIGDIIGQMPSVEPSFTKIKNRKQETQFCLELATQLYDKVM
jgi:hypothetical protein